MKRGHIQVLAAAGILAVAAFAIALSRARVDRPSQPRTLVPHEGLRGNSASPALAPETAAELMRLEAEEEKAARTWWAPELLAGEYGRKVELLWDGVNSASNKLELIAALHSEQLVLPRWEEPMGQGHGIELRRAGGSGEALSSATFSNVLRSVIADGWRLVQCEFRQVQFDPGTAQNPPASLFDFRAHLENTRTVRRAELSGPLKITWRTNAPAYDPEFNPARVDASGVSLFTREGPPPFRKIFETRITPPGDNHWSDPMLVSDLNRDGLPEIIFATRNLVYRRNANGEFTSSNLCRNPAPFIESAVIADFDGDGAADFLCAKYEGIFLFHGSAAGTFDEPGRLVFKPNPALIQASVITCGDFDSDGDLDLFIGQYKEPYEGGTTPAPFYDANDGLPAFLLSNDGKGNFRDVTAGSGLEKKRFRRTYSASFADMNGDGDLDLVVISDFAGLDFYLNDGRGHFADVTQKSVPDPHAFGMAHALADFNLDGRLDLLMIGMTSPAIRRLDHLGLFRPGQDEDRTLRTRMTWGNRLFLNLPDGSLQQPPYAGSIANSGWSWGCAAFDADNNGFPGVFIGNGLESNSSVRDYEAEYWLHDRFIKSEVGTLYFRGKMGRTRSRDYSYGGYEKNRFYLDRAGTGFLEAGFLMGVALEADTRNVVSADIDGDGRMDLILATLEIWPEPKQRLFIYRNELQETGNWIGFRVSDLPGQPGPGTQVTVRFAGRTAVRQIVSGDSYRSQAPATLHFGIGTAEAVDAVIRGPGRHETVLTNLPANRYYTIP